MSQSGSTLKAHPCSERLLGSWLRFPGQCDTLQPAFPLVLLPASLPHLLLRAAPQEPPESSVSDPISQETPPSRCLGCFHVFAALNIAAMNSLVQTLVSSLTDLEYISRRKMLLIRKMGVFKAFGTRWQTDSRRVGEVTVLQAVCDGARTPTPSCHHGGFVGLLIGF